MALSIVIKHRSIRSRLVFPLLLLGLFVVIPAAAVQAQTSGRSSDPEQTQTTGMQGTISSPPPQTPSTIAVPVNGRTFTETPITMSGLCTKGLVVKAFSNNVFIGAAECENGSYSMEVDLFSGSNILVTRVFDALDQSGPDSNSVTVNFQDSQFAEFGQRVNLTSNFAKVGALVGSELSWPIILSGGTAPYAVSVDWGDGSAFDLKSMTFVGSFDVKHTYKSAGIYRVIIKATDRNGTSAFLQLIGVGAGEAGQKNPRNTTDDEAATTVKRLYVWWPTLLIIPFALAAFWIGRQFEMVSIRRRLEKQTALYQEDDKQ